MTPNYCIPLECPSCGEFDTCYPDCICPACKGLNDQIPAWVQLAPIMVELNRLEWGWNWYHDKGHIAEITGHGLRDGQYFEVCISANEQKFIVDEWTRLRRANRDNPDEWDITNSFESDSGDAIIDFIGIWSRED